MKTLISHFELKHLRKSIGASVARMAELIGLSGDSAADSVRKMENGTKPISGPIQRIAKFMQEGIADGSMSTVLPEFMICADLDNSIEFEWIFHTRYPRFLAVVSDKPVPGLTSATADDIEWLSVVMWIDEPVDDPISFLMDAANRFANYTDETIDGIE